MVRRKVECAEVVPLRLCFRPNGDGEAELAKDCLDFLDDDGDRMLRAAPGLAAGERRIGERGMRAAQRRGKRALAFRVRFRELRLDCVERAPSLRSSVLRQASERDLELPQSFMLDP